MQEIVCIREAVSDVVCDPALPAVRVEQRWIYKWVLSTKCLGGHDVVMNIAEAKGPKESNNHRKVIHETGQRVV